MKRQALALLLASAAARAADFVPPEPGTYKLQHILAAPSGTVLETDGEAKPLAQFTTGKVTLLSLIYTNCGDGRGCPLATHRMQHLKQSLDEQPRSSRRLRFVSLSFDPDHDTPAVMRGYRDQFVSGPGGLPWHFLTTRSPAELKPLLRGFGQDVWIRREGGGSLSHVLKLFLIDRRGSVREIYSTSFLQPEVVLNDIRTLLLEESAIGARSGPTRRSASTSAR
jgi:protein SCO1